MFKDSPLNPRDLKPTQYKSKYTTADLLNLLAVKSYATTELQKELKDDLGMSSGTFYAIWLEVKKTADVSEDKDKRWIYIDPVGNPTNN